MTAAALSRRLGMSVKGVEWQLKRLKSKGIIRRMGANRGGHWEIISETGADGENMRGQR